MSSHLQLPPLHILVHAPEKIGCACREWVQVQVLPSLPAEYVPYLLLLPFSYSFSFPYSPILVFSPSCGCGILPNISHGYNPILKVTKVYIRETPSIYR